MTVIHSVENPPPSAEAPDVYFEAGYGAAAALMEGGDWILVSDFDGQWQLPLIVRPIDTDNFDATSPYGYCGVYSSPSLSPHDVASAWARTTQMLYDLGIVSVFLRHSPLVQQPALPSQARTLLTGHPTVIMNTTSEADTWDSLRPRCRTAIRKARAMGLSAHVSIASHASLAEGSDFRRLYQETMHRTGASSRFSFGNDYFAALIQGLGQRLQIAVVQNADGDPVATSLVMRHETTLHYHLSGSTADGGRSGANNLLIWELATAGRNMGVRRFHLGGGLTGDDSLLMFKRSFSRSELVFSTTGIEINTAIYRELVAKSKRANTDVADTNHAFFPEYRAL